MEDRAHIRRPPWPVRIAVLVAAIAVLGLAMCARAKPPQPATPAAKAVPQAQAPGPQGSQATQGSQGSQDDDGSPMELEEGKMGKKDSTRFDSSKAPRNLWRRD